MGKFIETVRSNVVFQAIMSLLLGLFLLIWPQTTIITLVCLLAAGIALSGIASLVSYARTRKRESSGAGVLVSGVFLLIIALIVFIFPEAVSSILALLIGALLVLSGVITCVRGVEMRAFSGSGWMVGLIVGLIITIGGIVIIVNPFDTTVLFVTVVGVVLVIKGISDLGIEIAFSRAERN